MINVTLFGSRGISDANSSSSGFAKMSSPRLARFREDSNLMVFFFKKKNKISPESTVDEQSPRSTCCIRVFCHNTTQLCGRMTPTYLRATLNKTLFESKRFQARFFCPSSQDKWTKSVPRRRGHHDSPPTYEQKCISLPIASFANPAAQTEPL